MSEEKQEKEKPGSMREKMPVMTAYIDSLRKAFGKEYVDDIIRRGIRGEPVFYVTENGYSVGTPVFKDEPCRE